MWIENVTKIFPQNSKGNFKTNYFAVGLVRDRLSYFKEVVYGEWMNEENEEELETKDEPKNGIYVNLSS